MQLNPNGFFHFHFETALADLQLSFAEEQVQQKLWEAVQKPQSKSFQLFH